MRGRNKPLVPSNFSSGYLETFRYVKWTPGEVLKATKNRRWGFHIRIYHVPSASIRRNHNRVTLEFHISSFTLAGGQISSLSEDREGASYQQRMFHYIPGAETKTSLIKEPAHELSKFTRDKLVCQPHPRASSALEPRDERAFVGLGK